MVSLWAEKEFRNLHRLWHAHIACPRPICVRQNVLLMSLIAETDSHTESESETESTQRRAAPRLKDCELRDIDEVYGCYRQVISAMRVMFWKCCLIHGDLSE